MKRTVICAILLTAMTVTGILLQMRVNMAAAETEKALLRIEDMPAGGEREKAALRLSRDWEDFCAENIFLTNNECAFEISQALFHISAELYSGDGDITEECRAARLLVEAYVRSCEPTLDNIF
ncbi:MAG: hypothetical protein IK990_09060 [Ruminiclostridium sp.]|nr:hypothetical protein [Ruminiclostridium sp.]